MSRDEIQKLLGGYATGTLTPAERDALFAAALEDQDLFDSLAREEALRELLQDPAAKARLRGALEPRPAAPYWNWLRRAAWAIPAVGLAAIIVVFVMQRQASRPVMIAQAPALPRMGPVAPVPSPVPRSLDLRLPPLLEARREPVAPVAAPPARDAEALKDQAPAAPPPPAETVAVEAAQIQQGQQAAAGVRLGTTAQTLGAVGGYVPRPDARALFFGQPNAPVFQANRVEPQQQRVAVMRSAAAAPVTQPLGIRYSILRRVPNRELAATIPNEVLDPNDQMVVRFESNEAGYLSVFERAPEGWRLLNSGHLERLGPYFVPASGSLTFDNVAARELFVVFSRQPQQTPYPVPEARLDQVMDSNLAERLTYVVSTAPPAPAQTIAFPIKLTHK
ncbi:MAG TPA: hypothetical protein VKT49_09990 [Bryobacteraceae bacterium]|nr:hypothetical protein [Bryobacteraceae bacterium]